MIDTILLMLILVALLLLLLVIEIYSFLHSMRKTKLIPWARTPYERIRRLLAGKPGLIKSWEAQWVEVFPHSRMIALKTSETVSTNFILCVGTKEKYDEYLITRLETKSDNVYVCYVDYIGEHQDRARMHITIDV